MEVTGLTYNVLTWAIGGFVSIGVVVMTWLVREVARAFREIGKAFREINRLDVDLEKTKANGFALREAVKMQENQAVLAQRLTQAGVLLERIESCINSRLRDHETRIRDLEHQDG